MRSTYPIALDLTGRRILIVGAGPVATRKARGLLDAGATASQITVVAPDAHAGIIEGAHLQGRVFQPSDLDGVDLCFAATNDASVNDEIVRLCRDRRILCNRADRADEMAGDFTVPAVHRDGPLTIAVCASGSPRLAAAVRDSIAGDLETAWAAMGEVALKLRKQVVQNPAIDMQRRKVILHAISSPEALETYKSGGAVALEALLRERFPELKGEN